MNNGQLSVSPTALKVNNNTRLLFFVVMLCVDLVSIHKVPLYRIKGALIIKGKSFIFFSRFIMHETLHKS